ncbi:SDR family NAD(P)-dependent oxidoreductase [Paraburkholderia sp. SARCC-3016]|jgi:dihydroanticapsin dehydrogenase|uniref:SDR family NAD(P)-dependent oxidoreductase n=1 Tax=Paraburkholderia sp. SARCC-3016 TaxID=3058611 RepID=UPI0028080559|nr:SDR family NAD(P)-dependent oxidoreductase [Paraburkholderia sp. SARCC-3016]MDQ7981075.1 SDR family NAD(P)-dependent oxidoreductase [Paraburkholderia sp. SARCC-3016]
MSGRLSGKRIVITGAIGNIGKEAVRSFVAEGARVVIGDIDENAGRAVVAELGGATHFVKVDVSSEASVANLLAQGVEWLGGLDVLAQNAGLQRSGPIAEFSQTDWDALFAVNARAHFFGAKHAVAHLKRSGKGSIINMSSLAGKRGGPGLVAYSASKGAVIAFTTALAMELAPDAIRVNAICPGWVDTAFNQPAIDFMGGESAQQQKIAALVPLGRQARADEIAPLFVYLASDESAYVTAQSFGIDGGVYNG